MTGAQQRTATDIDLWTRAFAKEQAQQAGMSVRAWLDEFIAREAESAAHPPVLSSASHQLSAASGHPASDDAMSCWSPAREAFGQRSHRPEALQAAIATQVSAASILARAVDDAGPVRAERAADRAHDEERPDELGIRARVSQAGASARRRLESDEIEFLLDDPAQPAGPVETEPPAPLSEVERALREMREQMDAAVQLTEAAASALSSAAPAPQRAPFAEASTEAIANLGHDIARLVDVMDCGFERVDSASAKLSLELRSEVSQMFDELASRIERFERESATSGAEPVVETSPAVDQRLFDSGPDEAQVAAQAPSPPTALPVLAATHAATQALEAPAVDDPDAELFEDPSVLAGLVEPQPRPASPLPEAPDGPAPAFAAHAASDLAQREAATDDDPDADLFDSPPKMAGRDSLDHVADDASADPFAWPAPEPSAEDHGAEDVWFGPGRHKMGEPPGEAEITVTGFDPRDRSRDLAADSDAKRLRFPWLSGLRGSQSRKSA